MDPDNPTTRATRPRDSALAIARLLAAPLLLAATCIVWLLAVSTRRHSADFDPLGRLHEDELVEAERELTARPG